VSVFSKRGVMVAFCAAFAIYSIDVYTAGTKTSEPSSLTANVAHGMALFQENNCIACHQFYGLGGYMGPDLTNVISAPDKGADYARAFIENGSDRMPNYNFTKAETDDLVHFLKFVAASGKYPPGAPVIKWNGMVAYDGD
jgi:nitric oxide reductase subunit C